MNTHNDGIWTLGRYGSVVSDRPVSEIMGSDCVEYYGGHLICESVSEANAKRIVLCVRAMNGVPDEDLAFGIVFGKADTLRENIRLRDDKYHLEQQCAALRERIEILQQALAVRRLPSP